MIKKNVTVITYTATLKYILVWRLFPLRVAHGSLHKQVQALAVFWVINLKHHKNKL